MSFLAGAGAGAGASSIGNAVTGAASKVAGMIPSAGGANPSFGSSLLSSFAKGVEGGGGISGALNAADALKAGEYGKLAGSVYAMGDEANKKQANPYRDIYNIYKRF